MSTDRRDSNRSLAFSIVLRLVAVVSSFGIIDLARAQSLLWVFATAEPGDGTGALAWVMRLMAPQGGGETWLAWMLAGTAVAFFAKAALVVFATARGTRPDHPLAMLMVTMVGLGAHVFHSMVMMNATVAVAEHQGVTTLANLAFAQSINSLVNLGLATAGIFAFAIALTVVLMRERGS